MKKHQIFIKGIYYYSFLFYISFILGNIFYACIGIDFGFFGETDMCYGFGAMLIYSVVKIVYFWWLYLSLIIFQIIFVIYISKHPEWKQIKLKYYLHNYIFYIAITIHVLITYITLFFGLAFI